MKLKKVISLLLAVAMLSAGTTALAAGPKSEGDISGAANAGASLVKYTVSAEGITAGDVATLSMTQGEVGETAATGLYIEGTDYSDGVFKFADADYTIGGDEELYEESFEANIGETITGKYNSVIKLKADTMNGTRAGAAASMTSGTLRLNKAFIYAEGNQRYAVSASAGNLIINDSALVTLGDVPATASKSEPMSNPALLVSGKTRTNMSTGRSQTYYFNSYCVTDGWAAMSTDSAMGNGLDFHSYNSVGIARTGGYGTYADSNCRVWLYGSTVQGAEIGAIISNNGAVHCFSGADATEEILQYNTGTTTDRANELIGGRNAFQIHSPDMMGGGKALGKQAVVEVVNSKLVTTKDLVSACDYYATYGQAVGKYVDLIDGAAILVKSHTADIDLTAADVQSHSNTILMTIVNSDSMSRYLKAGNSDTPTSLTMTDMTVSGDVKNYDYQRGVTVELVNTAWTGAVDTWSADQWNEYWKDCADDEKCYWILDPAKYSYNSEGTSVTIGSGSKWTVTGDSVLNRLTIAEGGTVEAADGAALHLFVDGVEVELAAGTYEGAILLTTNEAPESFPVFKVYFKDVASDAWYASYVTDLATEGVINGYADGSFKPDDNVTYGQVLKMAYVAAIGQELESTAEHWAGGYYAVAVKDSILPQGIDLNSACPRADVATICAKLMGLKAEGQSPFTDTDSETVTALAEAGVVSGDGDGTFRPNDSIKRSELAKMIWMLMELKAE